MQSLFDLLYTNAGPGWLTIWTLPDKRTRWFEISDLAHLQVETTDLSERDAPSVQVGQTASISVTALNGQFPAKVTDISRVSSTVGGDVVYKVTLQFDSQPKGLLWGMTTDVSINTSGQ